MFLCIRCTGASLLQQQQQPAAVQQSDIQQGVAHQPARLSPKTCSVPDYGAFGRAAAAAAAASPVLPESVSQVAPSTALSTVQAAAAAVAGDAGSKTDQPAVASLSPVSALGAVESSAAATFLSSQQCSPLSTAGRLLAVGGMSNCQVHEGEGIFIIKGGIYL